MDLCIRLIKAFTGPRSSRLREIWRRINNMVEPEIKWLDNFDLILSHTEGLHEMWHQEKDQPNRYVLFTEEDFLPDLSQPTEVWTGLTSLKLHQRATGVGVQYVTRDRLSSQPVPDWRKAGAWYLLLDKERVGFTQITFSGRMDPCNELGFQIPLRILPGRDCLPEHYGFNYRKIGTHMFWSRYLDEDPETMVGSIRMGNVQRLHDAFVDKYVDNFLPPLP